MSWETSSYVLGQKVGGAARKLVLMGYANHAHKDGRSAYPSIHTVAEYAEVDDRTAKRHVKALVDGGWMKEGDQQLVAHFPANKRPIVYDLSMSTQQREEWAALAAAGANALREKAATDGAKGQVNRGDNLTPLDSASSGPEVGGVNLSPQGVNDRGVIRDQPGVTTLTVGGDTGVTQTTQEPSTSNLPSSDSLRSSAAAGADGAKSQRRKKADAVDLTAAEVKHGVDADGKALTGAKRDKLSVLITQAWWDHIDATPELSRPAQRFPACQQIIKTALANGHRPTQIKCGLLELSKEARPLTGASLTIAMNSPTCNPGASNGTPRRRGDMDWDAAERKAAEYDAMRGGQ